MLFLVRVSMRLVCTEHNSKTLYVKGVSCPKTNMCVCVWMSCSRGCRLVYHRRPSATEMATNLLEAVCVCELWSIQAVQSSQQLGCGRLRARTHLAAHCRTDDANVKIIFQLKPMCARMFMLSQSHIASRCWVCEKRNDQAPAKVQIREDTHTNTKRNRKSFVLIRFWLRVIDDGHHMHPQSPRSLVLSIWMRVAFGKSGQKKSKTREREREKRREWK